MAVRTLAASSSLVSHLTYNIKAAVKLHTHFKDNACQIKLILFLEHIKHSQCFTKEHKNKYWLEFENGSLLLTIFNNKAVFLSRHWSEAKLTPSFYPGDFTYNVRWPSILVRQLETE